MRNLKWQRECAHCFFFGAVASICFTTAPKLKRGRDQIARTTKIQECNPQKHQLRFIHIPKVSYNVGFYAAHTCNRRTVDGGKRVLHRSRDNRFETQALCLVYRGIVDGSHSHSCGGTRKGNTNLEGPPFRNGRRTCNFDGVVVQINTFTG
jgi:hypothetical protein